MEFNQTNNNAGNVINLTVGKPLTKAEAGAVVKQTESSMDACGWWNMVCVHCGTSCGGMLAEFGKPSPEDLKYVCCPQCNITDVESYDGRDHVRVEFVPGEG